MATMEAVQRRRDNRAADKRAKEARKLARQGVTTRWSERREFYRLQVGSFIQLYFPDGAPHPIVFNPMYWICRRCGWDALDDLYCRDRSRNPITSPGDSETWEWWTALHFKQWNQLLDLAPEMDEADCLILLPDPNQTPENVA